MAANSRLTTPYESVMKDVLAKRLKPVYLLMGKENYCIDKLAEAITDATLPEEERDFNMHTFYGGEAEMSSVINAAQSFPMGSEHSLVVLREAQSMEGLEDIALYLKNPQLTTVLLIVYKNGSVDKRKKFVAQIAALGTVFESPEVRDAQLPELIRSYMAAKGVEIENKSVSLIAESVGADLVRLYGELDKLMLAVPKGITITSELVEKNIGISKDFNTFELQNALLEKNAFKAFQIVKYFECNPREHPLERTLPLLFSCFSTIMMAFYAPDKTSNGIANFLKMEEWKVRKNVLPALGNFSASKVLEILKEMRLVDEKSKGVNGTGSGNAGLLKHLVSFILS